MTAIGVIVNSGKQLGAGLEEFRAELAELGHPDPPWFEVDKSKHAPEKILDLVAHHGVDRVIAWGGDGTVRRCVHTLIEHDLHERVSIGIMPAGTGNLLAKNLGIPIDVVGAASIAVSGDPRPIDVGVINGQYFALMAGTGFDALLIRDADERDLKERFGRLGYVIAGVRHRDLRPARFEVNVDGTPWFRGDASGVITVNVGTILGGIKAFPNADPTDGQLDIGVINARTNAEWIRLLARAAIGRADSSPLTETTTGASFTINIDRSLPWEVDGGDRDRTDHYEIACLSSAIRIAQPAKEL